MAPGLKGRNAAVPAWPFFVGTALIMVANGLQGTLIALRAALEGFSLAATGMVMSGYFLGLLAGSLLSARLVRRVGHVPVFAAFASIASASILMQALFVEVAFWTAMRGVTGFCFGTMYVVVESWLNQRATNENRGRLLALHMSTVFAGAAAGQLLLNVADPRAYDLFLLVSILVSFAMVPLLLVARPGARPHSARRMSLAALYRASPLGFVSTVLTGMGHGAMFGIGPVYARAIGLGTAEVAWFMALGMSGAIFSQWPLGLLSDRFDRRRVMLGVTLVGAGAGRGADRRAGPGLVVSRHVRRRLRVRRVGAPPLFAVHRARQRLRAAARDTGSERGARVRIGSRPHLRPDGRFRRHRGGGSGRVRTVPRPRSTP